MIKSKTAVDMYKWFLDNLDGKIGECQSKIARIETQKDEIRIRAFENLQEFNETSKFKELNRRIRKQKREIDRIGALKSEVTYDVYKAVLKQFNLKVIDMMLDGHQLDMGQGMGSLHIRRVPRNYETLTPDWGPSNKRKAELEAKGVEIKSEKNPDGEEWIVFFTDPYWYRYHWKRAYCALPNKTGYKYKATGGCNGMRKKLTERVNSDPFISEVYGQNNGRS